MRQMKFSIGIFLGLLMCASALSTGCKSTKYEGQVLPIRERILRSGGSLPLDSVAVDSILTFVRVGGVRDPDASWVITDVGAYREFLELFTGAGDSILTMRVFDHHMALKKFIDQTKYTKDIVNSCDDDEPPLATRRAYGYLGYWWVFIIEEVEDSLGDLIPDSERRFSQLIVMKQITPKGEK